MALPRVTPGTYNYGAYSNPTPIKYKGGLGEGLAGIAVAGAQVIKAKKEQEKADQEKLEKNQYTSFQNQTKYKQALLTSMPNATAANIAEMNKLADRYGENELAYLQGNKTFDEYKVDQNKYQTILTKFTNFKNYVLDKAEGAEVDFNLIRQTKGDIEKWGRDKAFSYGAQGFQIDMENEEDVGFKYSTVDWDKVTNQNGEIDFEKLYNQDGSINTSLMKTVKVSIDDLFSEKNAFAPNLKYTYAQDAQFFNDSIQKLTPEAARYAKGNDNGFAVFQGNDKEKFKNEIVLPAITDEAVKLRGVQIYEDILRLQDPDTYKENFFDMENSTHVTAVRNALADQVLINMPQSFGRIPKDTTKTSAFAEQTAERERRLNAARNIMENIKIFTTKTGKSDPMQKEETTGNFSRPINDILSDFNDTILNRGYRIIPINDKYVIEAFKEDETSATANKTGKDIVDITSIVKNLQKTNNSQKLVDRLMSLVYEEDPYSKFEI
tara:strand:- start:568 stop:2049 length:1482 start_codon:yes stop_codon:yes gene_type:complete